MWQYGYKWWQEEDESDDPSYIPIDVPMGECTTKREAMSELLDFVEKEIVDPEYPQLSDLETLYADISDTCSRDWTKAYEKVDSDFEDDLGIEYYVVQL